MSVTDLNEYRARRRPDAEAAARAAHPSGGAGAFVDQLWSEVDLKPYLEAVERAVDRMVIHGQPVRRGSAPYRVVIDETHHFAKDNSAWDKLMADILARGAEQPGGAARRAWLNKLSPPRTLRSTDQGSNGGDAEGDQGDDRQPRS